jgi:hypothetical protein
MADNLIHIHNDDALNNPLCRLKLVVQTFKHNLINQSKFSKNAQSQHIRKRYCKTVCTIVISSQLSPPSLDTYILTKKE